jgi:ATP-dependent Clp protease ATP-binding subunit ClpA
MDNMLNGKVIGQEDAVKKVVKAIQRNRAGLKDQQTNWYFYLPWNNRCW